MKDNIIIKHSLENDKLITEFMDSPLTLYKEDETIPIGGSLGCYVASFDCWLHIINDEAYETKELKYHTSYDWIIPVIEKIDTIPNTKERDGGTAFVHIIGKGCIITHDHKEVAFCTYTQDNNLTLKEVLYSVAVQFIMYYNNSKNYGK